MELGPKDHAIYGFRSPNSIWHSSWTLKPAGKGWAFVPVASKDVQDATFQPILDGSDTDPFSPHTWEGKNRKGATDATRESK